MSDIFRVAISKLQPYRQRDLYGNIALRTNPYLWKFIPHENLFRQMGLCHERFEVSV